ncbi:MAG: hypothetical protein FJ102_26865 [Deltaproteobacteria bacterium]|nr:hypothetical protein [Deltaproteobacteria bacterium]
MLILCTLSMAATFPTLDLFTLEDKRLKLPGDIGSGRMAVLVGWSRAQDDDLHAWTGYLLRYKTEFWSLPLVGNLGTVFDAAVIMGLRAGLDADREARTVPVFMEPPDLKGPLESDAKYVDVYVVSGDGKIHLHQRGPFADDKAQKVVAAVK